MRIAFLSPLPPATTGIADYGAEVLELLAPRHQVHAFHGQVDVDCSRLPPSCSVQPVSEFLARHRERRFDVAVYQMGNHPAHGFLYEPLARVPGLLVLHDLVLHHSRATLLLATPEAAAYERDPADAGLHAAVVEQSARYRAEAGYSHPEAGARLAETHFGTVGALLPYAYPLNRLPIEAARLIAVHNDFMLRAVRALGAEAVRIRMRAERVPVDPAAVERLRRRYGLQAGAPIVGCFGLLTREKRIETVARAVARAAVVEPRLRLLLVGPVPDADALSRRLHALGVAERTVVTGRVGFGELPAHMELADVVVHLRCPTGRETSAALLRVLAQGRPTIISDLEHLADIPADAVLRADVADEEGEVFRGLLRLLERPDLRQRLGHAAAAFVGREHSAERCLAGYEAALERAAALPDPPPRDWPRHWPRPATA